MFSPLAKALLDAFSEAVIVFDPQGKVLYANEQARELGLDLSRPASDLMPALAELGGRLKSSALPTSTWAKRCSFREASDPLPWPTVKKRPSCAHSTSTAGGWPKPRRAWASAGPRSGVAFAPMAFTATAGASGPRHRRTANRKPLTADRSVAAKRRAA